MVLKPCKKRYSRNPATRRCKKRCKRVPSGRCQVLIPCKEGFSRSRVTNRCRRIATSRRKTSTRRKKATSKKSTRAKKAPRRKTSTKSTARRPSTKSPARRPRTKSSTKSSAKSSTKSSSKSTAPPSPQSNTQCHICLAQMKNTERRRRLACDRQHVFHYACINQWLRTKSTCPVCRGPAEPSSVIRPMAKSSKQSTKSAATQASKAQSAKSTAKSTTGRTWNDMIRLWKQGKHTPKIKSGVFWETSSVSSGGNSVYKETQVRTSRLPMTLPANPAPFSSHLQGKSTPVSFRNLGKDAILVSPPNKGLNYSHIGTFYSNASRQDIKSFWRKVAIEVEKFARAGTKVYVSTSGTNVHWLHVRIEKRPKYYTSSLKNT